MTDWDPVLFWAVVVAVTIGGAATLFYAFMLLTGDRTAALVSAAVFGMLSFYFAGRT